VHHYKLRIEGYGLELFLQRGHFKTWYPNSSTSYILLKQMDSSVPANSAYAAQNTKQSREDQRTKVRHYGYWFSTFTRKLWKWKWVKILSLKYLQPL